MHVDGMLPTTGVVLEDPLLNGIAFDCKANVVAIRQLAVHLPLAVAALEPEDVVLGGGNVKNLKELPPGCRAGNNANAFAGGFRIWKKNNRGNRSRSGGAVSKAARKPRG